MPYYGWVVGWNVSNLASNGMQLSGVFNANPDGGKDGIWEAGAGPTFTPDGSAFYFVTGNGIGDITLDSNGFPTTALHRKRSSRPLSIRAPRRKIRTKTAGGSRSSITSSPRRHATLGDQDLDLATDAALLPSAAGIPGHPNLLIAADKAGQLFLLDADNMGGYRHHEPEHPQRRAQQSGRPRRAVVLQGRSEQSRITSTASFTSPAATTNRPRPSPSTATAR